MQNKTVVDFVRQCLSIVEAGGYEESAFEDHGTATPDRIEYKGQSTLLTFNEETFELKITKRRITPESPDHTDSHTDRNHRNDHRSSRLRVTQ